MAVGKELRIPTRVYETKSEAERIPNMLAASRAGYNLIFAVGFLNYNGARHGRAEVPEAPVSSASTRRTRSSSKKPKNAAGQLRRAGGRLPGRLPRRPRGQEGGREAAHQRCGRDQRAGDRPLLRRLPARVRRRRTRGSRCSRTTRTTRHSTTRRSARSPPESDRSRARRSSSRWPVAVVSARSTRRRRQASGASASTPTSSSSARTC